MKTYLSRPSETDLCAEAMSRISRHLGTQEAAASMSPHSFGSLAPLDTSHIPGSKGPVLIWVPKRAPQHIRILQTMVAGVSLVLGL